MEQAPMRRKYSRSGSMFDAHSKRKNPDFLQKKIDLSGKQLAAGIILGVFLTIITIALHCIAFLTPHWKEISPKTDSFYVDGVDALIRTEALVYFNSVHRFTRHSYGLFQRCEYRLSNLSKFLHERDVHRQQKTCTKNLLPSYEDEKFNECHSLQYHRFCSTKNGKSFDINNDYLRATFDISSNPSQNIDSTPSCDCRYPKYGIACLVLAIFALIFLFLTAFLFGSFPFLKNPHQRLTVKCFGVLASLFSMFFILINLLVVSSYLNYESIEYLAAIERHYRLSRIYKLSQDTKLVTNRFLSSINITTGYSTKIAWIAFVLSIIDGILLMITCKIKHDDEPLRFSGIPMDSHESSSKSENEEDQTSTTPLTTTQNITDFQFSPRSPAPPLPPRIVINNIDEQSKTHSYSPPSCLKQSSKSRIHFEDEV